MEEPVIRKAGMADIPGILKVIGETWEVTYRPIIPIEQVHFMQAEIYNPAALAKQMAEGQDFYLLLTQNEPAGFAALSPVDEEKFKLNKLYVRPKFQGRAFGRMLVRFAEQESKARGGRTLILHVNRYNPAKDFYKKEGYTLLREEDIPIGDFWMNDFVLQKNL